MEASNSEPVSRQTQDELYEQASAEHGAAIARLCRAYEADPAKRAELRQEIHLALWRSLAQFNGDCSLRTWVYRVGHNIAVTHLLRNKRIRAAEMISLDAMEHEPAGPLSDADRQVKLTRLLELIQRLKPLDRQVITLYLEGEPASGIGEITGLSASNVATKVHRIKVLLERQFAGSQPGSKGERHA